MILYVFLAGMWALIILGGGLAVLVLGPLDLEQNVLSSVVKGAAAVALVVLWVLALVRLSRYLLKTC